MGRKRYLRMTRCLLYLCNTIHHLTIGLKLLRHYVMELEQVCFLQRDLRQVVHELQITPNNMISASINIGIMKTIRNHTYRLSYERRGDISFIARETISYFVTSERSERGTKYDIVTRAIKLILPSLECDNLFITYLCLYLEQKSDYIFKLFIL